MPRIVTAEHPSETDLLDLAAGRAPGEATAAARRHIEAGCRLCARRLDELGRLVEAVKEASAFDALLESESMPELPRPAMGRTLPFAKPRVSVDDAFRLSRDAEAPADLILQAARAGADELAAAMRSLDGRACRGFALLYAAQRADRLVAEDPNKALALAKALSCEAETLPVSSPEERISTPAPREAVWAEVALLESQALLQKGDADAARNAARKARELFRKSGDFGFGAALCDYYEGSAASFQRYYAFAQRHLQRALAVFTEFGQDHLIGRVEAALGSVHAQRGAYVRALPHFDRALETLDAADEAQRVSMTLNNKATALMRADRFDEARATFARALNLARRHGFASHVYFVRTGLAELDFRRREFRRALRAFTEIVREASPLASQSEILFSSLYIAECHARLGSHGSMASEIEALRRERQTDRFAPSPALGELFICLDRGTLDADLIAHVRLYLLDQDAGVRRAYRPLRLAG